MKIGIILFENNNKIILERCINNIQSMFLPNKTDKTFIIFSTNIPSSKCDRRNYINIEDLSSSNYKKYHVIHKHIDVLKEFDYVYYIDTRVQFVKKIEEKDIVGSIVGALHPGFFKQRVTDFTLEKRTESKAYIEIELVRRYFFDIIVGGNIDKFSLLIETVSNWDLEDDRKNINPIWGDESYINKYFNLNPPTLIIPAESIFFDGGKTDKNKAKILFNISTTEFKPTQTNTPEVKVDTRINLTDTTFIIPVCVDSEDRQRNLNLLLDFINFYFNTNVMIIEQGGIKKLQNLENKCYYIYQNMKENFFHKTKLLNTMIKTCESDYIIAHDSDVFCGVKNYEEGIIHLRNKDLDALYPFNRSTSIPKGIHTKLKEIKDLDYVTRYNLKFSNETAHGGIFMYNRKLFIKAGMENEKFKSWGPEDQERFLRLKKLGYRTGKLGGVLYHLDHFRGINSGNKHRFFASNNHEFNKIKGMEKHQLETYITTWSWCRNV